MNKNFVSALYILNIVWQCIFTLVSPAALLGFIAWLLVSRAGLEPWVYVPFITVGVLLGFISMVRFAISASEGLERMEKSAENESRKGGKH